MSMGATILPLAELAGHTDRVWHLSWSPAAPVLASCSSDKSVRMYGYTPVASTSTSNTEDEATLQPKHASTGSFRFSYKSSIATSHTRTVRSLSFSPTGATLATASFDSTVGIWQQIGEAGLDDSDLRMNGDSTSEEDWEPIDPLEGHESECKSVEWSADGRLLASCSRDKSVWVWEAVGPSEFECLAVLMEHSQDVKSVTWHPSEELLASASYDDTIKLYAADPYDDEWSCIDTLSSHTATVWSISFSPCGNYLVSAGDDLVLKIWGRDRQGGPETLGEAGEAVREEGGRMGPWSRAGVRIGHGEKWKWSLKGEIKEAHSRTIYSVDWNQRGGGLGRIVSAGGDGAINVFQMTQKAEAGKTSMPGYELIAQVENAHGVSDVNHVVWCRLSPSKAGETLRRLEGGEGDEDDDQKMDFTEKDDRWEGSADMFASAGDDAIVRVWQVVEK